MSRKLNVAEINKVLIEHTIKTDKGCWEWQRYRNSKGYGSFKKLGQQLAHRVSFILHVGPIPEGAFVLHRCDNPPCVNPEHLFLGNNEDNMKDCSNKGRIRNQNSGKTHCKKGHEFTEDNTRVEVDGARRCRSCEHERYVRNKDES